VVNDVGTGIELTCVRSGGKLRIKVVSEGYDNGKNVQFPRAIRAEGARYRVQGKISRLTKPGEVDSFINSSC